MTQPKIMVVEDEGIVALDLKNLLVGLEYVVPAIAHTGTEAIRLAIETQPDLVLMDIRLRGEMDGITAATHIGEQLDTAVVFLTAHADIVTLERAKLVEPFGYLIKPYETSQLKTTIDIALYKHAAERKERELTQQLHQEIAERKQVEATLRESEQKLRNIIDQSTTGIGLVDESGLMIEWNQAYEEITGLQYADVVGQPLWEVQRKLLSPHLIQQAQQMILDVLQTGQAPWLNRIIEDEITRPDGTHRIIQTTVFPIQTERGFMLGNMARDVTTRKQAEAALLESEEKHRTLFETMSQGVVYQSSDGTITSANPAAERVLGLTMDQLQGRTSLDPRWKTVHEDGSEFSGETHPAMMALKTGKEIRGVVMGVFNPADNTYRWIMVNAVPLFVPGEGTPSQVYTTFDDITERKRAEAALRESEEKYRDLIENMHDVIFAADDAGKVTYISPAIETFLGYSPSEVLGQTVTEFCHPDDLAEIQQAFENMLAGAPFQGLNEYRVLTKSGAERWMRISSRPILDGDRIAGVQGILADVTVRKQAEADLRASQQFLQSTLDALSANIAILDGSGTIVGVNAAWSRFAEENGGSEASCGTGVDYLSVCDFAVGDNSDEAPKVAQGLRELLTNQRDQFYLEYPCHSLEQQRWYAMRATRFGEDHDAVRVVVAHENITERILAEQQRLDLVMERERAVVLQRFVGNASHDLRTPLTTIKTRLYLLQKVRDTDNQQLHMDILEAQIEHLEKLLDAMLRMSRLDAVTEFHFETVDLNTLLQEIYTEQDPLAKSKYHIMNFNGAHDLPPVWADETHLRRAITNVVTNALHYTPNEGVITIECYAQEHQVVIDVRDTGIGIGPHELPHIFKRFYRADAARGTTRGGVGLGLAIAKKVIEAHQGSIEVESKPGQGSTFRILLPIHN